MSTTETNPEFIEEMVLMTSIIEHAEGIPAAVAISLAGLAGANAIIVRPVGRETDGKGKFTLRAEVHLGNIEGDVAAALLRDIADQLDGTNGEAVSDD